jgi:hypothetical protein
MNYYPSNFYSNYPYQSNYGQIPLQMQQTQQQQSVQSILNGKIVDSIEVAKVTDVPFGGYGIFPKADLSEIYIKSWNNNGTTSVITFKPVVESQTQKEVEQISSNQISEQIKQLEQKIDNMIAAKQTQVQAQVSNKPAPVEGKELNASAY